MDRLTAQISSSRLDEATTPLRNPPIEDTVQMGIPSLDEEIVTAVKVTTDCAMNLFPYANQLEIDAVFYLCKYKHREAELREKLEEEPNLLRCRFFRPNIEKGQTLLHHAACYGNVAAIRAILECGEANAFVKDEQGRTALHIAAALDPKKAGVTADDISDCVKYLIEAMERDGRTPMGPGAPVDVTGQTPLGYANSSKQPLPERSCDRDAK